MCERDGDHYSINTNGQQSGCYPFNQIIHEVDDRIGGNLILKQHSQADETFFDFLFRQTIGWGGNRGRVG